MKTFDTKQLRYALYARKSTDTEDKQVQSLPDQIKVMKAVAKREDIELVSIVQESESAKKPYVREVFDQLLKDIDKGEINGIVCWKIDRLSRNPTDSGRIQQLLQDGKLKHIQTAEKSYFPEDNAIVFSVEASMGNQYIRELSVNTKRGMFSKAESGGKNGIPPLGYLNDQVKKVIIKDPAQFHLVRTLWDKMLTGTYSVAEITRIADKELNLIIPKRGKLGGKAPAYSSVCALFKNDFYRGKVRFNGVLYDGKHTAMVTDNEFERVKQIIDPNHTARPKNISHVFQFTNLFTCGECGYAITVEEKTKLLKSTGLEAKYIYYHCTGKNKTMKCTQPRLHVSEIELTRQLKDKLNKYTISPDFYQLAIEALALEEDEVIIKDQAKTQAQTRAIEKKQFALNNLRRMRYNGEANDDSWYFTETKTLEDELEDLLNIRNDEEYKAQDWRARADELFTFARYAKEDFDSDDLEKKRAVVVKLGESLTILDRTIQFTPNKYFIPIEKMNESKLLLSEKVRTDSQQGRIGSKTNESLSWLRQLGSNQRPNR